MANFYLICGISGGGKTTLSHHIEKMNPDLIILDVDEYYAKINGDEKIRTNTYAVWRTLFDDIHDYEIADKDVLLTTNSLTVSQRRQFVEWFPTFHRHMLWVTAPLERCLEGNRSRYRHVPDEILKRQWTEMEFPNANEDGWDSIAQITNCWDNENYITFNLKGDVRTLINF